ncbi:MAG: hypothetical protein ACRD2U_04370 [Terriglobales bacterium]
MMLVKILGFGSNWWTRFGRDPRDRFRYTRHAAYFNSTGLRCGRKVMRHWIVPGLIRFNGVGDFNPQFPNRCLGETFECSDLVFDLGGNRVLFRRAKKPVTWPDYHLVSVSSERYGVLDFENPAWKSDSVPAIAVSRLRDQQEAMLLMRPHDWLRTNLGFWQLRVASSLPNGASLELLEDAVLN